jgi:integrase
LQHFDLIKARGGSGKLTGAEYRTAITTTDFKRFLV